MPRGRRTEGSAKANGEPLGFEATLWKAADKLRGSMDASEYKHVVLGLVFLKYVDDAFAERRQLLAAELAADGTEGAEAENLLESRDEYTAQGIFWIPPESRWDYLLSSAKQPEIGKLIDGAMDAIEVENPRRRHRVAERNSRKGKCQSFVAEGKKENLPSDNSPASPTPETRWSSRDSSRSSLPGPCSTIVTSCPARSAAVAAASPEGPRDRGTGSDYKQIGMFLHSGS
ncbi:MAG: type I restriction-modification system subunit M N-terminal domain-containing protein [Acidimicrobiales bacterium]